MNQPVPDELISAYFDGEVTPEEHRQAEVLLESSLELRQLLDDTSKLSALLHSFPRESAPSELGESIRKKVETITVSVPGAAVARKPSLRREWMAFGTGMLVTMAALLVYVRFDQPQNLEPNQKLALDKSPLPNLSRSKEVANEPVGLGEMVATNGAVESQATPSSSLMLNSESTSLPAKPEEAYRYFEREQLFENRSLKSDVATIEPLNEQEFLRNLKNGDVVFQQVVDPANAVAVVEFTVVDIEKGAEEIKLLLLKRDVVKADDAELGRVSKDLANSPFARKMSEQKQQGIRPLSKQEAQMNKHDDLIVIYARAKGDRLAETISESLRDHPDIYQRFEAQLPIGLPIAVAANSQEEMSRDSESAGKELEPISNMTPSVSAEGKLAVDSYANSNGLTANPPTNLNEEEIASKRESDSKKSSEGFATFRVVVDPQKQSAPQQDAAKQNFGASNKWAMAANNTANYGLNSLQNSMANFGNSPRYRNSRFAADQRDPRLVRMLIVLKPATINPAVTP